ncbi:hypothetical protein ACRAWF_33275 [Streptomyces sp. L7]
MSALSFLRQSRPTTSVRGDLRRRRPTDAREVVAAQFPTPTTRRRPAGRASPERRIAAFQGEFAVDNGLLGDEALRGCTTPRRGRTRRKMAGAAAPCSWSRSARHRAGRDRAADGRPHHRRPHHLRFSRGRRRLDHASGMEAVAVATFRSATSARLERRPSATSTCASSSTSRAANGSACDKTLAARGRTAGGGRLLRRPRSPGDPRWSATERWVRRPACGRAAAAADR